MVNSQAYLMPGKLFGTVKSDVLIKSAFRNFGHDEVIFNSTRRRELVEPRQIIMFYLRNYFGWSLHKIGNEMKKDHATVIYGVKMVKIHIETEKPYREKVIKIGHDAGIPSGIINELLQVK